MGIPASLEKLILSGRARSQSFTFGGSGLSSLPLVAGETVVVWGLQIFPFFDLNNITLSGGSNTLYAKVSRGLHWIEFSTKQKREGLVHRSNYINDALQNVVSADLFPVPSGSAVFVPVYWVFENTEEGDFLVCRVTTFKSPAEGVPVPPVAPPASEQAQVLPYTAASTVQDFFNGFGAGGFTWNPDQRVPASGNVVRLPRAVGDSGAGTALQIPATSLETASAYSFPLVNFNYVTFKNLEGLTL